MAEELTFNQIVEININIGASGKLINEGNLRFIISGVKNAKTTIDKAAILLYEIINLHPFIDGNKRTAFVAADTLLRLNGKTIKSEVTQEYVEEFAQEIAVGKLSKKEVKERISKMIK